MKKRPVIICTDPGIDDFIAMLILLQQKTLDIRSMIALSGNVGLPITVNNTLLAGELCGRPDVPVLSGSAKPLARPARSAANIHGKSGLGQSIERYSSRKPSAQDAAEFIVRTAREFPGELEIISLGPLTDVARALQLDPGIAPLLRQIVVMGGGVTRGNATKYAEFNIVADPEAADVVFASGAEVVMIGLDATHQCLQPRSQIAEMTSGTELGRMVGLMLGDYADMYARVHNLDGVVIHDAICALWLLQPELFQTEQMRIRVCLDEGEHLGQTMPVSAGAPFATVAMGLDAGRVARRIVTEVQHAVNA